VGRFVIGGVLSYTMTSIVKTGGRFWFCPTFISQPSEIYIVASMPVQITLEHSHSVQEVRQLRGIMQYN